MQISYKIIFYNNIWRNHNFLWFLCVTVNVLMFVFLHFLIKPGYKTLALRYNVLIGVEWYGQGRNLYLIPLAGLSIIILNYILYKSLVIKTEFFAPLAIFISFFIQLILFSSLILLTTVN
jgi:hypothetical protein